MTQEEINRWIAFNNLNWHLIPQYCWDIPKCNQVKSHESFAQAGMATWNPGKRHAGYNETVAAELTAYFGP
jgi:hypothetical protein